MEAIPSTPGARFGAFFFGGGRLPGEAKAEPRTTAARDYQLQIMRWQVWGRRFISPLTTCPRSMW